MVTGATTAVAARVAARSSSITRLLTTPRKVANMLDWRRVSGSILTLTISRDKLDLAVSWHPIHNEPLVQLPSVPLEIKVNQRNNKTTRTTSSVNVLCPNVAKELDSICERFAICGLIVNWPVEKDGWCGFSCGRVLFTLDQLVSHQSKAVCTRPICLWDDQHLYPPEDGWGRAAVYSRHTSTDKKMHQASIEQYHGRRDTTSLANLWHDFCQAQWPDLYISETTNTRNGKMKSSIVNNNPKRPILSTTDLSAWLGSTRDGGYYYPRLVHL